MALTMVDLLCIYFYDLFNDDVRSSVQGCTDPGSLNICTVATDIFWYDVICLLTAIGLTPGGSSTVHIYTQNNT